MEPTNKEIGAFSGLDKYAKLAGILFAYVPLPMDALMLGSLMDSVRSGLGSKAKRAIVALSENKLIARQSQHSKLYSSKALFSASGFTQAMDAAGCAGLLPTVSQLRSAIYVCSARANVNANDVLDTAEMVRFIASGGDINNADPKVARLLESKFNIKFKRDVAFRLANMLDDEPPFSFSGLSDPMLAFVPYLINARFIISKGISKTLEAVEKVLKGGAGSCDPLLFSAYVAGKFWTAGELGLDDTSSLSAMFSGESVDNARELCAGNV